jgi:hypothetical protein
MTDIQNPKLLYLKGALLLGLGIIAAAILVVEHPTVKFAALLAIAIWAFARSYYFAFYVVEHYIDGNYKYAGLLSFFRHALHRRRQSAPSDKTPTESD